MFRRTDKTAPAETADVTAKADGKGRPTPSRKEAEAAAKERARMAMDKKTAQKVLRERRTLSAKEMRAGLKAGDEKFLPARDQGPVKAYVRDWVDCRLTFSEFLVPLMIVILVLSYLGRGGDPKHPSVAYQISGYLTTMSVLLLLVDFTWTRFRLRKALKAKFGPEEDLRGTTFYAFVRVLQIRKWRLPKPRVKIGTKIDAS